MMKISNRSDGYDLATIADRGGGGGNLSSVVVDESRIPAEMDPLDEVIGESPGVVAVRERIARLLSRSSEVRRLPPVLIQGETGTGKGLTARAIHRVGPRASGPFVDVNCAAIPETLLEAEMFGFERGAFTDARQAKRGLFQAAHRGTLFLDEIGLLPEGLQAKLLKVIEERTVRRLGSTQSESVDVWVITATSTDLAAATRERRFREDLYHRLAVLTLTLPPLRERGSDILTLAEHFLARACADYDLAPKRFAPDARQRLLDYGWPGNVRELGNVMERVALLGETPVVGADALGLPELAEPPVTRGVVEAPARPETAPLAEAMDGVERAHLVEALTATDWNVTRAAIRLGISRNTLRYRIEKHGLRPGASPPPMRSRVPRPAAPRRAAAVAPAPAAALPAEAPEPAAVRWERRRLAVMRAAVADLADGEGPLESSRALEVVVDKVRTFGGRVEELAPAGLVAVFGLEPAEDVPRRAANAAMAIQRATERAWAREGRGSPRVALHVGQFMIGRVGGAIQIDAGARREAWAVLDGLLAAAEPGSIVVSEAASSLLRRRFDLGELPGPGPMAGEHIYRLGRQEREAFGPGQRLSDFIGRQRELDLLRGLLATAVGGRGQVVGIVGEAGIGKSRLLFEFRQGLRGQPVTYLSAHCVEHGSTIPFLPVLEILRASCRIQDTDQPAAIVEKIRASLHEVELDPDETAPYLLHLLGVREGTERLGVMSPEAVKTRTVEVLRQQGLAGSRRRPLVIEIEDLHWMDASSGEVIAALVESLPGAPILFLGSYRPGYRPAWMERSYATQVALGPLSAGDSRAVVQAVFHGADVPPALVEGLVAKGQGNPFFLEELARVVGATRDGGAEPAIPDTVQEAVMARLDRLDEGPRLLLQAASVLGREVALRVLREVWSGPGGLDGHLRELTRQEILHERPGLEETVHVFHHTLVQEVAYASLLDGQRRRHHAAAGAALEKLYAGRTDQVVERLAHHYGRSGEGEKAVDCALRAAEKARRRWANAEALAFFDAARARLDVLPDTEANRLRRIDTVVEQAEVKFALGRHAEHIQALEWIRGLVDSSADPRRRAAWHYWLGFLQSLTGTRAEVSIAHCRDAVAIADAGGFDDIRAYAESCLEHIYSVAGNLREAVGAGERALATFEARGDVWWACRTLWILSSVANAQGEWERGLGHGRRALALGDQVADLRLRIVGWWRLGSTHIQRGDLSEGLRCCQTALDLGPGPFDAAMARAMRGYGLVRSGDVAAGIAELEETLAWFERSNLRYSRAMWALRLAEGYLRRDDAAAARRLLEEVLVTGREAGYRYVEGVAERLAGETWVRDDPARAAEHLDRAGHLLDEIGARHELAKAWTAQAGLAGARGDHAVARALLARALAAFEALGTLDEPAHVRAALAALPGG
jgi:DNA-binding NtrC family response regulator/tetratricopeptide (TPR) repeat protein